MTLDMFEQQGFHQGEIETYSQHILLLRGYALHYAADIMATLTQAIVTISPFRHMMTSRGHTMSVAMTNCGRYGWLSDRQGYRYQQHDPLTGNPWPMMPSSWLDLAKSSSETAGYSHFLPDSCLINNYAVGSKMGLHQDKDEADLSAPIVSVSLGLPATYLLGGDQRQANTIYISLNHGDVLVMGGIDRLRYHGIRPIKPATHSLTGACRINLTFRKAN